MANVLVVANETLGGLKLMDTVKARAERGDAHFFLAVPQNRPRHGRVIFDEAVRDAAQVRIDLARQFVGTLGVDLRDAEIGDEDPFAAAMDAIGQWSIDEVIVSTHPITVSGWLRRDLVDRIRQASGLPVEHVVVDFEKDRFPFAVTLVLANQTAESEELVARLKQKAAESEDPDLFIVVMPQTSAAGEAAREARRHLNHTLELLRSEGLLSAGMIGPPDPYDAAMNALQTFHVTDVVVSTFPEGRSAWLRGGLIERLRESTPLPVEHVMAAEKAEV